MRHPTITILLSAMVLFSCNTATKDSEKSDQPFDMVKWKIKNDNDYPFRHAMLKDLIKTQQIKVLKKKS